jgi:hypothetical protein
MLRPIKYKRYNETHDEASLEIFFDELIKQGVEIIFYEEHKMIDNKFHVTIVTCKKQQTII